MTNQILTEEEIQRFYNHNKQWANSYAVDMLINSHRAINERNRLLVIENDELTHNDIAAKAKVQELYTGLKYSGTSNGMTEKEVYHATTAIEQVLQAFDIKILEVNDYE